VLTSLAACAVGKLADARPRFKKAHAACVVLASEGYPERPIVGRRIEIRPKAGQEGRPTQERRLAAQSVQSRPEGLDACSISNDTIVLQAGTSYKDGQLVTAGGRVLSVVGRGKTRKEALAAAYALFEDHPNLSHGAAPNLCAQSLPRFAARFPAGCLQATGWFYAAQGQKWKSPGSQSLPKTNAPRLDF